MLIKLSLKQFAEQVDENVITGISVTNNKGLMCSDFNQQEVLFHPTLSSCSNTLSWIEKNKLPISCHKKCIMRILNN